RVRREERGKLAHERRLLAVGREGVPFPALRDAQRRAELVDLARREQRRVIQRVARERKSPALDRVGEDDDGFVADAPRLLERVEDDPEVVTTAIGDELSERRAAEVAEQAIEHPVGSAFTIGDEGLAESARRETEQSLVVDVRHRVQLRAEPFPSRLCEELLALASPRELDHIPPACLET